MEKNINELQEFKSINLCDKNFKEFTTLFNLRFKSLAKEPPEKSEFPILLRVPSTAISSNNIYLNCVEGLPSGIEKYDLYYLRYADLDKIPEKEYE